MSEPTENSAPDPMCERALDYAYGELDGAQAAEFERHMKDCARCQSELALMKRVRTAVRAVLPSVEPPQAATGALHAQLLHAAAQRRPPRTGKVLQFARRVVSHPGYAAAAGLVIIGGAIGLQFARGGLQMPMHAAAPSTPVEASPVEAPKPAVAAGPAPAPAEPPVEGAIANNKDEAKFKKSADKETAAPEKPAALAERKPMADETAPDLYLRRAEPVAAKAPAPTHHASKPAASPKTLSADDSGIVYDGKLGNTGIGRVTGEVGGAGGGESSGGYKQQQQQQSWGGRAAGNSGVVKGGSANYRDQQQQAAAPHTRSAMPKADAFDAPSASPSASPPPPPPARYAQAPEPQAPQAQAPSAWNGNNSPSPPAEKAREVQAEQNQQAPGAAALQQPMQKNEEAPVNNLATSADALRRKAEELATSGRCEEAVKLYQELEKKYPTFVVSPRDRLPYVRCLRATGNEQLANDLDRRIDNNAAPPAASQQQMETVVAPSSTAHSERAAKAKAKPAKKSSRAVDESTLAPAKK